MSEPTATPGTNAPGQTPLSPQALELTKPVTPTLLDKSGATIGELEFSVFGAVSARTINNSTVDIPPERSKAFAQLVSFFSGQPNTVKRELEMPDSETAETLRAQLKCYAQEKGITVLLPKHVPAHVTSAGKSVPDNKYPKRFNVGNNVTFRFSTKAQANQNGPVTVTTVAQRAADSQAGANKSAADAVTAASKASK